MHFDIEGQNSLGKGTGRDVMIFKREKRRFMIWQKIVKFFFLLNDWFLSNT